jgi:hypothetical protein
MRHSRLEANFAGIQARKSLVAGSIKPKSPHCVAGMDTSGSTLNEPFQARKPRAPRTLRHFQVSPEIKFKAAFLATKSLPRFAAMAKIRWGWLLLFFTGRPMTNNDAELMTGVSVDELEALAAGILVPSAQARLDELLAEAQQNRLSASAAAELDDLLNKVDQLNLLKARARYTIDHLGTKAASP